MNEETAMIAIISALLGAVVAGGFALDDGLSWWTPLIFVGSWLGFYLIIKVVKALSKGGTVGDGLADAFGDLGSFDGDGGGSGGGGCGSGGGGD